jgi:chaperonin cofactor prefoldin
MDWFVDYFKIIQGLLTIVFFIVIWALAVTFVKKKDHSQLKTRVEKIELTYSRQDAHTELAQRVNTVENKVDNLPDKTTIHRVESEVKELKGILNGINQLQKRMNNQVDMLVENEIKGSK